MKQKCVAKSTWGKRPRCGNAPGDSEFPDLCGSHAEILRTRGRLELHDGQVRGALSTIGSSAAEVLPEGAPGGGVGERIQLGPGVELHRGPPPPPDGPEEVPADLFAFTLHAGPTAEPAATQAGGPPPPPPPPAEGVVVGGDPSPVEGGEGKVAAGAATIHAKNVRRAARVLNPRLRKMGVDELEAEELDYLGETWGEALAHSFAKADPNNPWGAAFLAAAVVMGPRMGQMYLRSRARIRAEERATRTGGAGHVPEVSPAAAATTATLNGAGSAWDRPPAGLQ